MRANFYETEECNFNCLCSDVTLFINKDAASNTCVPSSIDRSSSSVQFPYHLYVKFSSSIVFVLIKKILRDTEIAKSYDSS